MIKKIKALTIDNGGSELRVKPILEDNRVLYMPEPALDGRTNPVSMLPMFSQTDADQDGLDQIIKCPGPFYAVDGTNFREKEVTNKFHIINVLSAPNREYIGYYGVGQTAQMYSGREIEMTSQAKKTETDAFYQRFIFGMALGLISDKEYTGIETGWSADDPDHADMLNTEIQLVICTNIPIKEYAGDQDLPTKVKSQLAGSYVVEFPLLEGKPVLRFKVSTDYFGILPEGGVVISSLKDVIGKDEYSLLIDLGHITGDYAIYHGKDLEGSYVKSSSRAGSTLLTRIQAALTDAGYMCNVELALQALNEGTIPNGKTSVDVSDIITKAKTDFVTNCMKPDLTELFNGTGIVPKQIANIIPIGASMCRNARTGYMPYEIQKVLNIPGAEIITVGENARYANINSAYPFSKLLLKKAVRQQTTQE